MPSLYRPTYTKIDPKTGKKATKKLKKWYGKYRDANDQEKRVPLCSDKAAARAMLNDLMRKVDRQKAGLSDPFETHRTRPLSQHLADFRKHLEDKGSASHHVRQTADRAERVVKWCGFVFINDISASRVEAFLADLRGRKRGIQTSNHYLSAIKQFCRWLVVDRRTNDNPIVHLKKLNVETDRRHRRRALASDEFGALVDAAANGETIEDMAGPDRAMLYVLAAWTGYRRKELASLTLKSLDLQSNHPSIQVEAAYSKRRRLDPIPLHPVLVQRLSAWLAAKGEKSPDSPLFSLRTTKGYLRDTAKMMRLDLEAAREKWIGDAATPEEARERAKSDYLCYQNSDGHFADFHANRHTFISNLAKAGIAPKIAQTLARHSDINLTMNVYTHVGLSDQLGAIGNLPAPPMFKVPAPVPQLNISGPKAQHALPHVRPPAPNCLSMPSPDATTITRGPEAQHGSDAETASFDTSSLQVSGHASIDEVGSTETREVSTEPKVRGSSPLGCTPKAMNNNGLWRFIFFFRYLISDADGTYLIAVDSAPLPGLFASRLTSMEISLLPYSGGYGPSRSVMKRARIIVVTGRAASLTPRHHG